MLLKLCICVWDSSHRVICFTIQWLTFCKWTLATHLFQTTCKTETAINIMTMCLSQNRCSGGHGQCFLQLDRWSWVFLCGGFKSYISIRESIFICFFNNGQWCVYDIYTFVTANVKWSALFFKCSTRGSCHSFCIIKILAEMLCSCNGTFVGLKGTSFKKQLVFQRYVQC